MDNIRDLLSNPPSKRTVKRACLTCGSEFDAVIYILPEREIDGNRLCSPCEKDKRAQEEKEKAAVLLDQARRDQRERWRKVYGVYGLYPSRTFENFEAGLQPQAYQAVKEYHNRSLILLSPNIYGVGKTHLVAALANYLIENKDPAAFIPGTYRIRSAPCPVYFAVESSLLARIRNTYNDQAEETEEKVFRSINGFPLLIIDDVGKVRPRDMSFLQSVYFRIIDQRYVEGKPIVITTNLDAGGLNNHIGAACFDRLFEMAGVKGFITMTGASYRRQGGNG